MLELGAGTGRVALDLARAGVEVTAVERDPELLAALERRARAEGLELSAHEADARSFALERRFALALAAMQFVHLLGGREGRAAMLGSVRAHLEPGGRLAAALLTDPEAVLGAAESGFPAPVPDVGEHDGWVLSSLPLAVERAGDALEVRRLRQRVSPAGELHEELAATRLDLVGATELEAEAAEAGYEAVERVEIAATDDHVGSTVLILEAR